MHGFEKPPVEFYIQCEETLERSESSEAVLGMDVPWDFQARPIYFWIFWSKPCTEQSQHGLPLCPFVISLLANEPLSSPPAQILTAAALLQPDQLSLVQGVPGQLWLSHNSAEPGVFLLLEIVWGRSAPGGPAFCLHSYFAKEPCGRDCKGGILDVHGLYHITLHFVAWNKERRCAMCSDVCRCQTRPTLLFHSRTCIFYSQNHSALSCKLIYICRPPELVPLGLSLTPGESGYLGHQKSCVWAIHMLEKNFKVIWKGWKKHGWQLNSWYNGI